MLSSGPRLTNQARVASPFMSRWDMFANWREICLPTGVRNVCQLADTISWREFCDYLTIMVGNSWLPDVSIASSMTLYEQWTYLTRSTRIEWDCCYSPRCKNRRGKTQQGVMGLSRCDSRNTQRVVNSMHTATTVQIEGRNPHRAR